MLFYKCTRGFYLETCCCLVDFKSFLTAHDRVVAKSNSSLFDADLALQGA